MSSLLSISIKSKDGSYKSYTISISDETNQYGQNVAMWIEQSKEERESKKPRTYIGNGRVVWTDNKINVAEKTFQEGHEFGEPKEKSKTEEKESDLPF